MIKQPATKLSEVITQTLGTQIARTFIGRLGDPVTGQIRVNEADIIGLVYVHGIGENPNSAYTAENRIGLTELVYDRPVEVGYTESGKYKIVGLAVEDGQYMNGVNLNDQVPVNRGQMLDGGLVPNDASDVLYVGTTYIVDDAPEHTTDQNTGNLIDGTTNDTSAVAIQPPATANKAIMVLVQIDPTTNAITYKQSAEFPASYSYSLIASGGNLPSLDVGNAIAGYVKLVNGQTIIKREHITSLPDIFRLVSGGIVGYIDQSGGTSDTYGVISGTIDGANTTFTVSQAVYNSGTLTVYLNGQLQTQGTAEDWTETSSSAGTFDFITAPLVGDEISATYSLGNTTTIKGNIVVTKTSDYTVLGSEADGEIIIKADCTSGDLTVTLPTASSYQNRKITVKRIDSSVNEVIVDGNGSETIDGDLTVNLSTQYTSLNFWSDGSEWSIT
jgi:hypothetical protein